MKNLLDQTLEKLPDFEYDREAWDKMPCKELETSGQHYYLKLFLEAIKEHWDDADDLDNMLKSIDFLRTLVEQEKSRIPLDLAKNGITFKEDPIHSDLLCGGTIYKPKDNPRAHRPMPEDEFLKLVQEVKGLDTSDIAQLDDDFAATMHMDMQLQLIIIAWNNPALHKYLTTNW